LGWFSLFWIRIRIRNVDPDPDPEAHWMRIQCGSGFGSETLLLEMANLRVMGTGNGCFWRNLLSIRYRYRYVAKVLLFVWWGVLHGPPGPLEEHRWAQLRWPAFPSASVVFCCFSSGPRVRRSYRPP
jgi:hypothetical protein